MPLKYITTMPCGRLVNSRIFKYLDEPSGIGERLDPTTSKIIEETTKETEPIVREAFGILMGLRISRSRRKEAES